MTCRELCFSHHLPVDANASEEELWHRKSGCNVCNLCHIASLESLSVLLLLTVGTLRFHFFFRRSYLLFPPLPSYLLTMRSTAVLSSLVACLAGVEAFAPTLTTGRTSTAVFGYVPDGFTAESYKKFKEDEAKKKKANLGGLGPRGFQSRSMQSFQEALERGEAGTSKYCLICRRRRRRIYVLSSARET